MTRDGVVIIGGGQAASQLAVSLRENGYGESISIVAAEPLLPYQRPPLSKAFLKGEISGNDLILRSERYYADNAISVLLGERAVTVDRHARQVHLASRRRLAYGHLVFATGSRNRGLAVPGATLAGIHSLRSVADADALKAGLADAEHVAVVGAGFVGLEFACVARGMGKAVVVIEAASRPMARALSQPMSDYLAGAHRAAGIELMLNAQVGGFEDNAGRVARIAIAGRPAVGADLVLVGIGAVAEAGLAQACGLATNDGIAVDRWLTTADPQIHAIGDCARFATASSAAGIRLESVQNAVDQARCLAGTLTGEARAYEEVPWFWSDQGPHRIQIAGLTGGHDRVVVRGDAASGRFSLFCYRGDRLLGVESVNQAGDHMLARRLLAAKAALAPEQAADPAFDLKSYVLSRAIAPRRPQAVHGH